MDPSVLVERQKALCWSTERDYENPNSGTRVFFSICLEVI